VYGAARRAPNPRPGAPVGTQKGAHGTIDCWKGTD